MRQKKSAVIWWETPVLKIHTWYIVVSPALRAIPEKKVVRSKTEKEDDREAEGRLEDDKTEEARREVVESLRTLLVTQVILLNDYNIVTIAIEVMGSAATAATAFLQSS